MSNNTMKSLFETVKEMDAQLPLMEGRDKGENKDILSQKTYLTDYGFLTNEAGEPYAVFTVKERPNKFYFGGTVITEKLTVLESKGFHDAIVEKTLPMVLFEAKGKKSNRTYVDVKFYPDGEE